MRLLLVEDDAALSKRLRGNLKKAGFAVDVADNGIDAEYMGVEIDYDIIVLDLGLPKKPGLEVLKSWRDQKKTMPVLVLTARDAWYERVDGFKAGADDYLGKPFHFEELLVRIQALIRRQYDELPQQLMLGDFTLDEEKQMLIKDSKEVELTGIEFRLLRYFLLNPGKILTKTRLTEHVYENDADKDSNVIEVYVNHLRNKLGKEVIKTKRGQGYVYSEKG